jgi:hypothetical protein
MSPDDLQQENTMNIKTNINRNIHNKEIEARSRIVLRDDLVLYVRTSKGDGRFGGIISFASVMHVNGTSETFIFTQDYSRKIATHIGRATMKNITEAHQTALSRLPDILLDVRAQYGLPEEPSAVEKMAFAQATAHEAATNSH